MDIQSTSSFSIEFPIINESSDAFRPSGDVLLPKHNIVGSSVYPTHAPPVQVSLLKGKTGVIKAPPYVSPLSRPFLMGLDLVNRALEARVYHLFLLKIFGGTFLMVAGLLLAAIGKIFEIRREILYFNIEVKNFGNKPLAFFQVPKYSCSTGRLSSGGYIYGLHPTTHWETDWVPVSFRSILGKGFYFKPGKGGITIVMPKQNIPIGTLQVPAPLSLRETAARSSSYENNCTNFGLFGIVVPKGTELTETEKTQFDILYIPHSIGLEIAKLNEIFANTFS